MRTIWGLICGLALAFPGSWAVAGIIHFVNGMRDQPVEPQAEIDSARLIIAIVLVTILVFRLSVTPSSRQRPRSRQRSK